jgi:hypothetical protein
MRRCDQFYLVNLHTALLLEVCKVKRLISQNRFAIQHAVTR